MRYEYPQRVALFLLLDTIPEHIQKTFGLTADGKLTAAYAGQVVAQEGEAIPDRLDGAVIIYHTSHWHMEQARTLMEQIESLQPRCLIMGIAVYQG